MNDDMQSSVGPRGVSAGNRGCLDGIALRQGISVWRHCFCSVLWSLTCLQRME